VAALAAQLPAAEALLSRGAWVDATDSDDATPLLLAARAGCGALVRRLLRAGAARDAADKRGLTPLAHAVANDAPEATQALLSAGADATLRPRGFSLLHLACALGAVRAARLLLAHGGGGDKACSVRDARNAEGLTPAHAAAAAAQPAALALVLGWRDGGAADVDARAADGSTPLDCAAAAAAAGDAPEEAAACEAALRARGARRGADIKPSSSAAAAATAAADVASYDDATREACAFAALPPGAQARQLERWAAACAAPGVAPPPAAPPAGVPSAAAAHLHAAGLLRLDAELDEVVARLLDDDTWQERMADPSVRAAVEEVQADANAVLKWGDNPACMAALGELRRLQAFCKPRGLKTSLPALLRRADNTPADARARMERCAFVGALAHSIVRAVACDAVFVC
jgi:ankyrin repeat protein